MTRRCALVLACVLLLAPATRAASTDAAPESESKEALFDQGTQALAKGAPTEAIDRWELLSDRGVTDRNISFNRGVAYLRRAAGPSAKSGDLGKAAAAFAECTQLDPSDDEATRLFEEVQRQIAQKQLRAGETPVRVHASLWRAVASWAPEDTWAVLSLVASVLVALGMGLRLWTQSTATRLAGAIALGAGAAGMLFFGSLAGTASYYRRNSEPAVVITEKARLLDEMGRPAAGKTVEHSEAPEGALVYILQRHGRLTKIEWGDSRAWVQAGQLRPLATP